MIKLKALTQDDSSLPAPRTGPCKETEIDPSEVCFVMLMTWKIEKDYHGFTPAKMGDKPPEGSVLVLILFMKHIDSDTAGLGGYSSPANYLMITEGIQELIDDMSIAIGPDWSYLTIFMTHIFEARVSSNLYARFDDKIMVFHHGPADGWVNLDLVYRVDGRAIDIHNIYGTMNDVYAHTKYMLIATDTDSISEDFKRRCAYKLRDRPGKPFQVALPLTFVNGDYPRFFRNRATHTGVAHSLATITNEDWSIRYAHFGGIDLDDRRIMLKADDAIGRNYIPYFEVILNEPITAVMEDGSSVMADYFWVLFPSDGNATIDDMFCMIYRTPAIWQAQTIDIMSFVMNYRTGINYADIWFTVGDGVKFKEDNLPKPLLEGKAHYLSADTHHNHNVYVPVYGGDILKKMIAQQEEKDK